MAAVMVPSTEHSTVDHEIGIIPIDAVYSPITRVRYEVEDTRVGQKTNYDKLVLEIWTDGTITPEMALVEASKILRKHLNPFVQYRELGPSIYSAARGGAGSPEAQLEAKLKHDTRRYAIVGSREQLFGERKHTNDSRPGAANRRFAA